MNNRFDYEEVSYQQPLLAVAFASLMRKVYLWMGLALAVSGLTAYYVASNATLFSAIFSSSGTVMVLCFIELGLVLFLSARINKMRFATAGVLFVLYSLVNGLTLSAIFMVYTLTSIASTFFITAGTFVAMSIIGYSIKKDMSGLGRYLLFALIGIIISGVVNIFLHSSGLQLGISIIAVLVFTGLTAYDTQKIKKMFLMYGSDVNEGTQKLALLGSLTLYLDFVNLFLYLLRFLGDRK